MTIIFTDGIEIVIDDEKLASWEQNGNYVSLTMKNGKKLQFDKLEHKFCEV